MPKFRWWLALAGTLIFPTAAFAELSSLTQTTTSSTTLSSDFASGTSNTLLTTSTTFSDTTTPNTVVQLPIAPSNLDKSTEPTRTAIYLTWQDNSVDETHFNIERKISGESIWSSIGIAPANNSSKGNYTDANGIKSATSYLYRIQACKKGYGCSDFSFSPTITTPPDPDIIPPSAPTALAALLTPEKKVRLTWYTSFDNVGVVKYIVFKDGALYGSTITNDFPDISVFPGQTYKYYIIAVDAAQNRSGTSNTVTITIPSDPTTSSSTTYPGITTQPTTATATTTTSNTSSTTTGTLGLPTSTTILPISNTTVATDTMETPVETPDLYPPSVPSNITVTTTDDSYLKISWSASNDDKGIKTYKIFKNNSLFSLTQDTFFVDGYVLKGETYTYYIVAVDISGKASPKSVDVKGSVAVGTDTTVQQMDTLKGQVIDSDGSPIAKTVIHIWNSYGQNFYSVSDDTGNYHIEAPAGNYKIEMFLPPSRTDLIRPGIDFTTLIEGEIRVLTHTIAVVKSSEKILSGSVVLPNGQPVNDAKIFALNRQNNQWFTTTTTDAGQYTLNLSPGTWFITIGPVDPAQNKWAADQNEKSVIFANNLINENKKITFSVKELPVKVKVKLLNDSNLPVSEAGVSIERSGGQQSTSDLKFDKSDSSGYATFFVTPGKYVIRGFSPSSELLNPDDVTFNFTSGAGHEIVLKFKTKQAARGIISGNVTLLDGTIVDNASVWGWSEMGSQFKTETDMNGNFFIPTLPNDKWHINANKSLDGFPYRSGDMNVSVSRLAASINLKLFKSSNQLPPVVQVKQAAENPVIAVAKSGASVYVPSGAATSEHASTTSSVTVTIEASSDAPSRPNTRVVGNTYDIKVENSEGKSINKFDNDLEISLPYTDEMLKSLGVKNSSIQPSYFDDATGVWVRINDYVINKDKKVVILKIKHLTRFALVAPADTTPPPAPTKLSYKVKTVGSVLLSWVNPSSDFHHVKIYRSDKKSSTGILLSDLVTNPTFSESGLKKATYYYTLKTVDAAGNESLKGLTVAVNAGKTNSLVKIPTGLKLGSSGEGVKLLQEVLVNSGYLPKNFKVTSKFDKVTQEALKKFQKNRKISQTGTVGPATATALNKLIK